MKAAEPIRVAIVDYKLGNLYSVQHACRFAGLEGFITSSKDDLLNADAVILPGVGAFGDAMENLRRQDLVGPLRDIACSTTPLIGICLGLQLLMSESHEFGRHGGLGIISGPVVRFDRPMGTLGASADRIEKTLKVPQIGWNGISRPNMPASSDAGNTDAWTHTPLQDLRDGEYMYFVHSFYAQPEREDVILSKTTYGDIEFCSSLRLGNTFAFQFHPERSGPKGLHIYHHIASLVRRARGEGEVYHA